MDKNNLDKKSKKAILRIEEMVADALNILSDLSMKLCHLIKDKRSYQDMKEGSDY